jgi:hypothetical protein
VLLDDLRDVGYPEAEIPGSTRVDDDVWAVLAQAEAIDGVNANGPGHASLTKLAFEHLADVLRTAFLAVATLADQHVGLVVPYLREGANRPCVMLFRLLRSLLGDTFSSLAMASAG